MGEASPPLLSVRSVSWSLSCVCAGLIFHLPLRLTLLSSHEFVYPVPNFFYFHLSNTPS